MGAMALCLKVLSCAFKCKQTMAHKKELRTRELLKAGGNYYDA